MPVTAKIVLAVRALLASITRIGCMVAFFCPVLGLLSMMAHWKAEQTSLDPTFMAPQVSLDPIFRHNPNNPDFNTNLDIMTHELSYWNLNTNAQVNLAYSFIYRSNYTDPENPVPPEYAVYTGVALQEAYAIFWALISVQYVSILTIKMRLSDQFRATSWKLRLLHIVETINLPDWFSDWDVGEAARNNTRRDTGQCSGR